MNITVLSINYLNAPIEVLEACSCNKDDITTYLSETIGTIFFDEMVIVSTCNRTEWVFISPEPLKATNVLLSKIKEKTNISESIIKKHCTIYSELAAMSHLFQVVCGLKSMVLGENEILTQVKESYSVCREFGATSAYLNKFFQLMISTGKEVRTVTKISKGAHSISSIAIEAIKDIDADFLTKPMLLIGAGIMIQRALAKLTAMGHEDLWIANRTMSKAESLTSIYTNLSVIPYASIKRELDQFKTIYLGIHSKQYFLNQTDLKHLSGNKIIVDVSVPRCVDPSCDLMQHISFVSVDKLESIANQTIQTRASVIPHVHACIRVAISELNDWLAYRDETFEWVNERAFG